MGDCAAANPEGGGKGAWGPPVGSTCGGGNMVVGGPGVGVCSLLPSSGWLVLLLTSSAVRVCARTMGVGHCVAAAAVVVALVGMVVLAAAAVAAWLIRCAARVSGCRTTTWERSRDDAVGMGICA